MSRLERRDCLSPLRRLFFCAHAPLGVLPRRLEVGIDFGCFGRRMEQPARPVDAIASLARMAALAPGGTT